MLIPLSQSKTLAEIGNFISDILTSTDLQNLNHFIVEQCHKSVLLVSKTAMWCQIRPLLGNVDSDVCG